MLRFILHRLLLIVPTFIGITLVAFIFIRMLPGDPVLLMAGERAVSPERHAQLMAQFGFDQPLWRQYADYLGGLLHGDFGYSFSSKTAGAGRVHGALPGDAGARALRHHHRHRARGRRRDPVGDPAGELDRPARPWARR